MAFIPTTDGARAVLKFTMGAESWSNVLWFTKANFLTSDMEALGDDIGTQVAGYWKPRLDPSSSFDGVDVYDMRTSTGLVVHRTQGAGVGTGTGDMLPLNVALCVTLRSANRGRSARGRVYLAGLTENDITDGAFVAAASGAAQNMLLDIRNGAQSLGWTHVIRSTQKDHQVRSPADTYAVTIAEVRYTKATTQRRRVDRA